MTDNPTTRPITGQMLHDATYGEGPLAYEWQDKPHRLLIEAGREIDRLRTALANIVALGDIPRADIGDAIGVAEEALDNVQCSSGFGMRNDDER